MVYRLFYLLLISLYLTTGCSDSSSSSSTYTYNNLTLTGALTGLSSSAVGDESDYIILFQNQISNRLYMAQVESGGAFKFDSNGLIDKAIQSVDHTSGHGDHFMVMLLKKDPFEMKAVAYLQIGISKSQSNKSKHDYKKTPKIGVWSKSILHIVFSRNSIFLELKIHGFDGKNKLFNNS